MASNPRSDQALTDLSFRVRWYVKIRWFFLLALSVPGIVSEIISQGFSPLVISHIVVALLGLSYNAVFFFLAKRHGGLRYFKFLAAMQLVSDILLSTYLIYTLGGVESRTLIVYAIPIFLSGTLLSRGMAYLAAGLSAAGYNLVLILEWLGVITTVDIVRPELHADGGYILTSIIFYNAVFIILGAIASFTANVMQTKEKEATEKTRQLAAAQTIAKIGSWEWDIVNNKVNWSDELFRIFGLEPKDSLGTYEQYMELVHPDDRNNLDKIIKTSIESGEPFKVEHRLASSADTWIYGEGKVILDIYGQPKKLIGTAQDITERKKAEVELFNRNAELEKLNKLMVGRELKMADLKKKIGGKQ